MTLQAILSDVCHTHIFVAHCLQVKPQLTLDDVILYLADVQILILVDRTTLEDRGGQQRSEPTRGSKNLGNKIHSQPRTQLQTSLRKCLYTVKKVCK